MNCISIPPPHAAKERYAQSRLIVVAHHNENIDWTKGIPPGNGNLTITAYSDTTGGPGYRLVPPGRGYEARAFLRAIVDHYDDLPDAMAFIHGHSTSWHTFAGPDNNVGNTWRMAHLTWPVNEYYVALSVRLGQVALQAMVQLPLAAHVMSHRAGSSPAPCSVRPLWGGLA